MDPQTNSPLPDSVIQPTQQPISQPIVPANPPAPTPELNPAPVQQPSSPSPINISNVSFKGVESSFNIFLLKRWWLILLGLAASVGMAAGLEQANTDPLYGVIPLVLVLAYLKKVYEYRLFAQFAKVNNYTYSKKGTLEGQTGQIFSLGHSQKYSDIVSGQYASWAFLLFMYKYTIGYGRGSTTYRRAVISVNFNTPLPTFVLRRHKVLQMLEEEGESLKRSGYSEKVNLEGDFNKHFEVYIKPGTQDDVLSILAPDVMETLIGLDKYEIEMTSNGTFYVYCHGYLTKKQSLINIYTILGRVTTTIGRYANRERELHRL